MEFSSFSQFFLFFLTVILFFPQFFELITYFLGQLHGTTPKLNKAICSFYFLFGSAQNLPFHEKKSKLFTQEYKWALGSLKWALGPFKITRFARDFKIGPFAHFRLPLAHLYSLMNNFDIFLTEGQIFLTGQRENKTNKVLFLAFYIHSYLFVVLQLQAYRT